ncbi:hypothetical protein HPB50_017259 [Hyalomma asiaticum]|uniref:Uncharacterized protein n=1 Tax=Hyalomma asiaticum TaxID=266040 RepID=A0ACB7SFA7_HYAAI|nr:hypothetical protein HPB50_017259 [Hyalomma asiaticum]
MTSPDSSRPAVLVHSRRKGELCGQPLRALERAGRRRLYPLDDNDDSNNNDEPTEADLCVYREGRDATVPTSDEKRTTKGGYVRDENER